MLIFSEPQRTGVPAIWAEDHTCKTDTNGQCKISSPKNSRVYMVRVIATDEAGNTGSYECSTIVGDQDVNADSPLFLLAKLDFIGGVEVDEDVDVQALEVLAEAESAQDVPWVTNPTSAPTTDSLTIESPTSNSSITSEPPTESSQPSSSAKPSVQPSSSSQPTDCMKVGEPAPGGCPDGVNPRCCSGECFKKSMLCKDIEVEEGKGKSD